MIRRNIVLVGMAGCGKSTVGLALAQRLCWKLTDSDQLIVEDEGMSIPDIFAEHGEAYFREAESRIIARVMQGEKQIVAAGGGSVLAERNREAMRQGGLVVALAASAETIIRRVSGDTNRPLLKGNAEKEIPLLLERRKHAYDFADLRIDTDDMKVDEIADKILRAWKK